MTEPDRAAQADFIARRLNRWYLVDDARRTVRQAQQLGIRVAVNRLQLGDPTRPEFGNLTEIYRTKG